MAVLEQIVRENMGVGEDVEISPDDIINYLKDFWDKYGTWIIIGIVAIIGLVIASKFLKKTPAPHAVVY